MHGLPRFAFTYRRQLQLANHRHIDLQISIVVSHALPKSLIFHNEPLTQALLHMHLRDCGLTGPQSSPWHSNVSVRLTCTLFR